MRRLLLSLQGRSQFIVIVGSTLASAFAAAFFTKFLLILAHSVGDTNLSVGVYQVIGTLYGILLAFVVSGVWGSFNSAVWSVQAEAYAVLDLIHAVGACRPDQARGIRAAATSYLNQVVKEEWLDLAGVARGDTPPFRLEHSAVLALIKSVQELDPRDSREVAVFHQSLKMLSSFLDARRTRLLSAKGNSVGSIWWLLTLGALVLFACHGAFLAQSSVVWAGLLLAVSLIVGMALYLVFALDSPFVGRISASPTPLTEALAFLQQGETTSDSESTA